MALADRRLNDPPNVVIVTAPLHTRGGRDLPLPARTPTLGRSLTRRHNERAALLHLHPPLDDTLLPLHDHAGTRTHTRAIMHHDLSRGHLRERRRGLRRDGDMWVARAGTARDRPGLFTHFSHYRYRHRRGKREEGRDKPEMGAGAREKKGGRGEAIMPSFFASYPSPITMTTTHTPALRGIG